MFHNIEWQLAVRESESNMEIFDNKTDASSMELHVANDQKSLMLRKV